MAGSEVREGFLCPVCLADLGALSQLQQHFDEAHSDEDKDVVNQLKDFFSKAKRKILGEEEEERDERVAPGREDPATSRPPLSPHSAEYERNDWEPQEIGTSRSHYDAFRQTRDSRIDSFVMETNKLIIRLDKLVNGDIPSDPNKRKAYEKSIVPWAADSDFNYCMSCRKKFNITRRRHHCRICGNILCHHCSQFMPESYAKKLTNPAHPYEGEGFRRSSSNSSLNSILSPDGEPQLRTCEKCRMLLERRDQQIEQRNRKPLIVQLYEKLKQYMDEADDLLPKFLVMAESLRLGETQYGLSEAQMIRNKVAKLYENVDFMSKRILQLGLSDAEPPSPQQLKLQRSIRSAVSAHLQDNLLGLQSLPNAEELLILQEKRRMETERRLEAERLLAVQREAKKQQAERQQPQSTNVTKLKPTDISSNSSVHRQGESKTSQPDLGWKPMAVVSKAGSTENPMIEQMNIIRGFVKQAKEAGRWDEVEMLESNLSDLQQEYWRQQNQS